jgi:hypothetical protein
LSLSGGSSSSVTRLAVCALQGSRGFFFDTARLQLLGGGELITGEASLGRVSGVRQGGQSAASGSLLGILGLAPASGRLDSSHTHCFLMGLFFASGGIFAESSCLPCAVGLSIQEMLAVLQFFALWLPTCSAVSVPLPPHMGYP